MSPKNIITKEMSKESENKLARLIASKLPKYKEKLAEVRDMKKAQ